MFPPLFCKLFVAVSEIGLYSAPSHFYHLHNKELVHTMLNSLPSFKYPAIALSAVLSLSSAIACGGNKPVKKVDCPCTTTKKLCNKPSQQSWWNTGWNATLFAGPLSVKNNSEIFFQGRYGPVKSGLLGFAVGKKMFTIIEDKLDFETEHQFVQHFGQQHHQEFQPIVAVLRWKDFPWNDTVQTTFAFGDGISIASRTPKLEKKARDTHAPVLNHLMAEFTFADPAAPEWQGVFRYHHRSGMFCTFSGVRDASTAFTLGVKRFF